MPLLEVRSLSYAAPRGRGVALRRTMKPILRDVSFTVGEGSTVGLLGPSGSGKTTVARCIAGLLRPQSGSIIFQGRPVFPLGRRRRGAGASIQMLFQGSGSSLDPLQRVEAALLEATVVGRASRNRADAKARVESVAGAVGLGSGVLRKFPPQLSGGEQQRVALARALASDPALLILDEPTSALDVLTQCKVLSLVKSLQGGRRFAVLLITHDVPLALRVCDRIVLLHEGTVVEAGSAGEILTRPRHEYTRSVLMECGVLFGSGGRHGRIADASGRRKAGGKREKRQQR